MKERDEYVAVPLPKDEDEPDHPDLEPPGELVDIDDPRLTAEILELDPEADSYATAVTLRVGMDMRGVYASTIAVLWQGPKPSQKG